MTSDWAGACKPREIRKGFSWWLRWWRICLPMQEMQAWSLSREGSLEKEMAILSSSLAWKIPWTEEPGQLQPVLLHRIGHDWGNLACITLSYDSNEPRVHRKLQWQGVSVTLLSQSSPSGLRPGVIWPKRRRLGLSLVLSSGTGLSSSRAGAPVQPRRQQRPSLGAPPPFWLDVPGSLRLLTVWGVGTGSFTELWPEGRGERPLNAAPYKQVKLY